jgi:hypothetical protein
MNPALTPIRFLFPLLLVPVVAPAAESKFPCPASEIARYTACHGREPIRIDGYIRFTTNDVRTVPPPEAR